jgi:uncharacterized BrkB/YihY/UPF0761 family membrane protein
VSVAAASLGAAALLLSRHARQWGEHDRLSGSLGAAMALLVWFSVGTVSLLLGMAWTVTRADAREREEMS